jgi:hypothetical protein
MIRQDYIERIRRYGYTETEGRFLYLAATHSGYFTQRQFLHHAAVEKGGLGSRLIAKARALRHIRSAQFGLHTLIHNIYGRRFYEAIAKENIRNRRHLSPDLVRTRLLILDFVLAHPDLEYLETEHEKVGYFHSHLKLSVSILPCRVYKGAKDNTETRRYFVDRCPIFLDRQGSSETPAFVYCDHGEPSLLGFVSYLETYKSLLRSLPAFRLIYASPNPKKCQRAQGLFTRRITDSSRIDLALVQRYFVVRRLWESGQTAALTRADRDLLRQGDEQYRDAFLEEIYRKWSVNHQFATGVQGLLDVNSKVGKHAFETHLLPDSYDILDHISVAKRRNRSGTIAPNAGSGLGSTFTTSTQSSQVQRNTGSNA